VRTGASHLSCAAKITATSEKQACRSIQLRQVPHGDPKEGSIIKQYSSPLIAISLAAACSAASATECGTVISSSPVTAQVTVPQQQCSELPVPVQPPTSGSALPPSPHLLS
jgi:hypothetical protein